MFYDTHSTGATFKTGTVTVNGVNRPTADPTVGFALDDIGIGNVVTITFQATVTSIPPTNIVTNQATINYKYLVDQKQLALSATIYTNKVTTNIAVGKITVTKSVDKQYATIGENLTYTVVVKNVGNINATNVMFLDATPANSEFVIHSVTVNGVSYPTYNPAAGFALNTLLPGEQVTVVYQVKVVS